MWFLNVISQDITTLFIYPGKESLVIQINASGHIVYIGQNNELSESWNFMYYHLILKYITPGEHLLSWKYINCKDMHDNAKHIAKS